MSASREFVNFVRKVVKTAVFEKNGRMFSLQLQKTGSDLFLKGKEKTSFIGRVSCERASTFEWMSKK